MLINRIAAAALLWTGISLAHVGSPDIYLDAAAGPYRLFVTVKPPAVIPGVAQIAIRSSSPGITRIRAVPLGMTGASSKFTPVPDLMQASKDDPRFFTGAVWLMQTGSWQIRIVADGPRGEGVVSVPLPAVAQSTKRMPAVVGFVLLGLMSLLAVGIVAIAGAAVGEAQLDLGAVPGERQRGRGRIVMAVVCGLVLGTIWFGNRWWNSEADDYGRYIYKPLQMTASVCQGRRLQLRISDPGWLTWRKTDDFIPDHNHLMHLYMIREPGMNVVYHLHPDLSPTGDFQLDLPDVVAGHYRLYADVVHQNGFPETITSAIELPQISGRPLAGDDASATAPPVSASIAPNRQFVLPDGYRLIFEPAHATFQANRAELFRFKLLDPHGAVPGDMALYMGMLGHAAFVKSDGSVFAHIHPNGTVAMAAFMMIQPSPISEMNMRDMPVSLPNVVSFPYGFPTAGQYRIIVQMKHGQTIETGIFDALVDRK